MRIYSETSAIFIKRVLEEIRALFFNEIETVYPVKFNRSRVSYKNVHYPLSVVVFEDDSKLGYFDYRYFEIGISKKLMVESFDQNIRNVIRHELAHYLCYLFYGPNIGHGEYFRLICKNLNWDKEVFSAYANIEQLNLVHIGTESKKNIDLLEKVKKLLALSSSDNSFESELATIKANKILLEHNLELIKNTDDDTYVCVKRVLSHSKKNAKHLAIYEILKTFYVSPVFNHGQGLFYLEIIGTSANVEIAEYVCAFLDLELDRLWEIEKKKSNLKGIVAKNSFFRGLTKGYIQKINNEKNKMTKGHELVLIQNGLNRNLNIVYGRLKSSYSTALKSDSSAEKKGMAAGNNLSIRPSIKSSDKTIFLIDL